MFTWEHLEFKVDAPTINARSDKRNQKCGLSVIIAICHRYLQIFYLTQLLIICIVRFWTIWDIHVSSLERQGTVLLVSMVPLGRVENWGNIIYFEAASLFVHCISDPVKAQHNTKKFKCPSPFQFSTDKVYNFIPAHHFKPPPSFWGCTKQIQLIQRGNITTSNFVAMVQPSNPNCTVQHTDCNPTCIFLLALWSVANRHSWGAGTMRYLIRAQFIPWD